MVLLKNWSFFHLFFLGNRGKEIVFYDILERKNAFLGNNRKKVQKVEKLTFLQKGLTHGFAQKLAIFPSFLFKQYTPGKCV